ncbi:CNOT2 [Cordylochernes scorpioides]|uniref:CNOT2 n=1 Tax=Cordylochernes scorpioides TaxID=51811 RepID=A0ABY6KK33_9ARAC|nr:CNOT2 [Cordylochernes scorpioides]
MFLLVEINHKRPSNSMAAGNLKKLQIILHLLLTALPVAGPLGADIPVVSSSASSLTNYSLSQHNSRNFGSQNLMNSGMSNSTFSSTPGLDLSEFPSLTNRGSQDSNSNPSLPPNPMAGRPAYEPHIGLFPVGMVKQPNNESNEFQIHNEDFPALPGSQTQDNNPDNKSEEEVEGAEDLEGSGDSTGGLLEISKESRYSNDKLSSQGQKRGIQTSKDGRVTNIPSSMVMDQFGMVGLLTFIRAAETEPNLVSLALGNDLTTLGLNLNTPESLFPTFGGPWSDQPCRPQDIDYYVPIEYLVNHNIKEKLATVKFNRYGDDLLFFIFYMYSGDILQLAAANELYSREWRYHKDERVWITRLPGMVPTEKTSTYERGTYYFFDAINWRKVAKEFHLDYERLDDRPQIPAQHFPPIMA